MPQNRKDEAETATGWKLTKFSENLLQMIGPTASNLDLDMTISAPISSQSLTKRSDERNYCTLL